MMIVAYDGGEPVKSGSLRVTVKVIDSNDNVPVFERAAYEFTVTEDQPPGSVVGKVVPSFLGDRAGCVHLCRVAGYTVIP